MSLMNGLSERLAVAHVDIAASRLDSKSPSSDNTHFSGRPFSEQLMIASTYTPVHDTHTVNGTTSI